MRIVTVNATDSSSSSSSSSNQHQANALITMSRSVMIDMHGDDDKTRKAAKRMHACMRAKHRSRRRRAHQPKDPSSNQPTNQEEKRAP